MATWDEFATFMRKRYRIAKDEGDLLVLGFGLHGDRSQLVFVQRATLMSGQEEWAVIESPIGPAADIDLNKALSKVGSMVVGGLAMEGDVLVLKHPIPLANLDTNELERPLNLLVGSADDLERELVGGDKY